MSDAPSADESKPTVKRQGLLSVGSVAVQGILRFLYSVVIGRSLGPAALGAANSGISLAQFLTLTLPASTGNAASTFIARALGSGSPRLASSMTRTLSRIALVSATTLALVAGALSAVLYEADSWIEPVLVALLTFALATYSYVRGVYFATGRIGSSLLWDSITTLIGLGMLVGVVLFRWNALLLLPLALAYGLYAAVGWPRAHRHAAPLPRDLRNEVVSFLVWTSVNALSTGGFLQLTMVIARAVGTRTEAGEYAAALSLATPASMIASVLTIMVMPMMARAVGRADIASLRRQLDLSTRGLMLLLGLSFGCLILLSRPLVSVLFGDSFSEAQAILPILMAASFVQSLNVGAVNALVTGHRTTVRVPSLLSVAGALVGLLVMTVLVPSLSVTGVALGFLSSTLVSGFGPLVVVWRLHRMRWSALSLRMVAGAAVVIALAVLARLWDSHGLLSDVLSAVIFVLVWLSLMLREAKLLYGALG